VAAGRHITFIGRCCLDVDDGVEEVGFTMLASEVLETVMVVSLESGAEIAGKKEMPAGLIRSFGITCASYPRDDVVMARKMCLADLASEYLV